MHNLKNIDLDIPKNKLIVITGLSGSGKSSLAFDTLYAEGQRRYIESLSSYARQFLGKLNKPLVDSITGISPAIAIEQKVNNSNPRSTVGTSSEIYDYLKLLFARIGKTYSPISNLEVKKDSIKTVIDKIKEFTIGDKFLIMSQKTATENVFSKRNIPFRSFEILDRNEKTLGELFCFFILETILVGRALKINPYNQPSVELIKKETKKLLIK